MPTGRRTTARQAREKSAPAPEEAQAQPEAASSPTGTPTFDPSKFTPPRDYSEFMAYPHDDATGYPYCNECGEVIDPPEDAVVVCNRVYHSNEAPPVVGQCSVCGKDIHDCEAYIYVDDKLYHLDEAPGQ